MEKSDMPKSMFGPIHAAERAAAARSVLLAEIDQISQTSPNHAALVQSCDQYHSIAERAIDIACTHHAGQFRQNGDFYVTHPIAVARLVLHWGGDADAVLTAILHDVVEDSPAGSHATLSAIASEFGSQIAWNIFALSKSQSIEHKDTRNRDAYERVENCLSFGQMNVAVVKLADRLHNTATTAHLSASKRTRLFEENRLWYAHLARRAGALELVSLFAHADFALTEAKLFDFKCKPWAQVARPVQPFGAVAE